MVVLGLVAALVVVGVLYQMMAARRRRQRFPPPGLLIDVGGHRLHAICRGHGSPIVLLESGIAASSLSWAAVQPEIAKFARGCAYDRAGLAWSEAASCPRSFEQIVDELSTILARVAPGERYVLVGHSFGSFVIRAYAARNPDSVVGLVVVDPCSCGCADSSAGRMRDEAYDTSSTALRMRRSGGIAYGIERGHDQAKNGLRTDETV